MSFDLADFSYSRQRPQTRVVDEIRHFTISVRSQTIGLPVDCVKTIFYLDKLTPVPLAPPEVAGLANLRGRIVTALYLDRCLRIDSDEDQRQSLLAVGITHNGEDYALIVDDTGDVIVSENADRISCPAHLDPDVVGLMSGCYRYDGGFLSIIDIASLIKRVSQQCNATHGVGAARNSTKGAGQ
ncbi:MAG: chemotaxis protein CheW [Methylocystis sp.]|jgi:purine-binding chemotaxis protein CheW